MKNLSLETNYQIRRQLWYQVGVEVRIDGNESFHYRVFEQTWIRIGSLIHNSIHDSNRENLS